MHSAIERKLFLRYFAMFLLVLAIPTAIIGSSVSIQSRRLMLVQCETLVEMAAHEIMAIFDQYIIGMDTLTSSIMNDADVLTILHTKGGAEESAAMIQAMRKLAAYKAPNIFLSRIIVGNNSLIMSNEGLLLKQDEEEIQYVLEKTKNNCFTYCPERKSASVYYMKQISVKKENGKFVLYEIPVSAFSQLSGLVRKDLHVGIQLTCDGNIIYSNGAIGCDIIGGDIQENGADRWEKVKIGGKVFYLHGTAIDRAHLHGNFLLPESTVISTSNKALYVMAVYILLAILFGIVLSLVFTYRNYTPLKPLISDADFSFAKTAEEGLEAIGSVYTTTVNEKNNLQQQVQQEKNTAAESILMQMLHGVYGTGQCMREMQLKMKEQYGMCFDQPYFRVEKIILNYKSTGTWSDEWEIDMQSIVKEAVAGKYHIYCALCEMGAMVCLMNYSADEDVLLDARSVLDFLNTKYGVSATSGISSRKENFTDLPKAYMEAEEAVEYRLIKGENRVIIADDVPGKEKEINMSVLHTFRQEPQLQEMVASGNISATETLINNLFESIQKSNSISMAKCMYYEIINMVFRTLPYNYINSIDITSLLEFETLDELRMSILRIYKDAVCRKKADVKPQSPIEKAQDYIRQHYSEPSLSTESVASSLGLSRGYLSRLFSENAGTSMSEFISRVRIKKACEMLKETEMTAENIARNVGYVDFHTFVRNFKKYVGKTPTQYREE